MNIWLLSIKRASVHCNISNLLFSTKCSRLGIVKQLLVNVSHLKHPRSRTNLQIGLGLVPTIGLSSVLAEEKPCIQPVNDPPVNNPESKENEVIEEDDGWKRLKAVFQEDEFGCLSKELNATLQGTGMGLVIGLIYGGINQSKEALADFMERNQASIFENHLDAKRRLQNHVTIHFAQGAAKWGLKISVFTGGFLLFLTSSAAYRGEAKVIDYVMSGGVVGAILRLRLGPPAIIVGGLTGAALGLLCGLMTQTLLSFNNSNLDEVLAFQHELERSRRKLYQEGLSKSNENFLLSEDIVDVMKTKERKEDKAL